MGKPAEAAATDPVTGISPGAALGLHALDELDAASTALADADLHEGVHRARKSLRRVRSMLALGDGILGPGEALLDRELRRLNEGMSALRDAHALVETIERLRKRKRSQASGELLERAHAAAVAARDATGAAALLVDPAMERRRSLIAVVRAALPALAWERVSASAMRMAIADADVRVHKARERAQRTGDDRDWHRWRRRARRASQQRHALTAIGLPVHDAPDAFDKRTAERLGEAQDLSLLLAHCGEDSPFSNVDRKALKKYADAALGRLRRRIAGRSVS
ncbi:CHAD domain-containing protein [Lysobacter panacisoli]|uniref:CHAD domain-containing protein n=1 Tax=Lysobacter panacisoli TaxID=1255263 RepID=A0ABP9L1V6_9GAMM|nr:CHAD domain-containing protein [Lysobacter panacisoli]